MGRWCKRIVIWLASTITIVVLLGTAADEVLLVEVWYPKNPKLSLWIRPLGPR